MIVFNSGVTSLVLGKTGNSAASNGIAGVKSDQSPGGNDAEWGEETRKVPEEYFEEEPYERTEYRTVTEERLVPQVKAIYAFEGQGMTMTKGEVRPSISFISPTTFLFAVFFSFFLSFRT